MARSFYHIHPDTLTLATEVVDAAPGRVLLAEQPFFAGGGGQLADRGRLRWSGGDADVTGFERLDDKVWVC